MCKLLGEGLTQAGEVVQEQKQSETNQCQKRRSREPQPVRGCGGGEGAE